ncbi:unnamed protein product [Camellia sinensis]
MLGTYFNVVSLGFLFLLFSSWVAYVMFEDTEQGKTIFTSFGTTLYQTFVLFTTSNNPDAWIPAYKASRCFKSQLAKQVSEKDRTRKRILRKVFNLTDKNNCGYLNKEQCIHQFEELNKYSS